MTRRGRRRGALVGALASVCLALGCARGQPEEPSPAQPVRDAIVVLGHRPARDEHGVEPETRARVEHGVSLFQAARAPRLVFTGGHTGEGPSEAEVMAELAEELGVPDAALRRESASRNTIENARFTVDLLSEELGRRPRIVLVTSDYHIKRAARLFRCAGAEVEPEPASLERLSRFQRFSRRSREAVVRVTYWFFDECERVRDSSPPPQRKSVHNMSSKSS